MKHTKKKVTLESLHSDMSQGFQHVSKQVEGVSRQVKEVKADVENLAGMTKREFDAVHSEIDELRSDHGGRLANLEQDYHEMVVGQEDIKDKLDNAACKFEVRELQTRVERLEQGRGSV